MERLAWLALVLVGCGGGSTASLPPAGDGGGSGIPGEGDAAMTVPDEGLADGGMIDDGGAKSDAGTAACTLIACGGDLLGSWHLQSTCYGPGKPLSSLTCPRLSIDERGLETTGEMVFSPNMTYTINLTTNGTRVLSYDTTCPQYTCDSLKASLGTDVSCQEAANVCTCNVPYQNEIEQESGTISLDHNVVIIKPQLPQGLSQHRHSYCVAADDMKMSVTPDATPGGDEVAAGVYQMFRR